MRALTFARGKHYLGIDLGTTFSTAAYLDGQGQPVTIPNAENQLTTPSVVLFEPGGDIVVGREARQASLTDPGRVADSVKRDMGEPYYSRRIGGSRIAPEAISALVLKKLKQDAAARLGPIGGAVITVPAFFDERRREATVSAGLIADLEVLDIINEPTAAALAYGLRDFILKGGDAEQELRLVDEVIPAHTALIYDLGGGTFDVTLMRIEGSRFTVLATDGDVRLGGRDWDEAIVNHAAELFEKQFGADPRSYALSHQSLILAAEQAKMNLTQRDHTRLAVTHGGEALTVDLTREQFERMTVGLLYRTEHRLKQVVEAADMTWDQIDQVLTVGGATRMRQVLTLLESVTGKKPNCSLSPDEVVAHGAAVHAAITLLRESDPKLRQAARADARRTQPEAAADLLPGLQAVDADALAALPLPAESGSPETGTADLVSVDADDEPVPLHHRAAADRAGQATRVEGSADAQDPSDLTQVFRAIETTNVNAHSLGILIKREDGVSINSIIIPRNTPLPASVTKRYGTNVPNQTAVSIRAVEGEAELADECTLVGACDIHQLPWGLRKGSTIYITFSYDNSGRLAVKAVEATSGKTAEATIHREGAMSPEQIDRAKKIVDNIVVS